MAIICIQSAGLASVDMLCDKCHEIFNGGLAEIRIMNNNSTHHWAIWRPCRNPECSKHGSEPHVTWEWLSQRLESRSHSSYRIDEKPLKPETKFHLHHTLEELSLSAERGCISCSLLVSQPMGVLDDFSSDQKRTIRGIPVIVDRDSLSQQTRGPTTKEQHLQLRLWYLRDGDSIRFGWPGAHGPVLRIGLQGPRLPPDTERIGSFQKPTLDKLVKWLAASKDESPEYRADSVQASESSRGIFTGRPRRLLHILNHPFEQRVQLKEIDHADFEAKSISYATLSHCWGSSGPSQKLLRSQHGRLESGVPWTDLPKTFRDALEVASALGLQYIWIDALCIIQDSREDWIRESVQMGSIYANSVLNIAATGARNSEQGLFLQAESTTDRDVQVHWRGSAIDGVWYLLCPFIPSDPDSARSYLMPPSPLDERAWVLQERLLSSRIVEFPSDQIRWQSHSETGTDLDVDSAGGIRSYDIMDHAIEDGRWPILVQGYMQRVLTYHTDRLVAFSAIAQAYARFHQKGETDYLAGLWRQDICRHLLWHLQKPAIRTAKLGLSPEQYVAPSWSWASLPNLERKNLAVENDQWYTERGMNQRWGRRGGLGWGAKLWNDDSNTVEGPRWQDHFVIEQASIQSSNASHFGPLTNAYLDVKCPVYFLSIVRQPERNRRYCPDIVKATVRSVNGDGEAMTGSYHADDTYDAAFVIGERVHFMPLALYVASGHFVDGVSDGIFIDGLVLAGVEPDGAFRRVGMLTLMGMENVPAWWYPGHCLETTEDASSVPISTKRIRMV
ncbi:Uu.00g070490.m01.CDS01 [Anthostomella pinea]|uniref:Uu.00g070490.m01.CDS01 n=1 Tax=Anthostomella pinea TaxID=933095 RepID=A0AAI8VUQ0_9PEZI|nr:Uu.00g070490.m01.CDS01 [Anthostomella pinea]